MSQAGSDGSDALARRAAGGAAVDRALDVGDSSSTLDVSFENADGQAWTSWTSVPAEVRASLASVGCTINSPFASGAVPPRTERRRGQLLQRASAWAVTTTQAVVVHAERRMRPAARRSSDPGHWELEIRLRPVVGTPGRRVGTVPWDGQATSSPATVGEADEPAVIDLLPSVVRRQIIAAVPAPDVEHETLVQTVFSGIPQQQEAALLRASRQHAIAVAAKRTVRVGHNASRRRAELSLDRAEWRVEALTAELGPETVHRLRSSAPALNGPNAPSIQASGVVSLGRDSGDRRG